MRSLFCLAFSLLSAIPSLANAAAEIHDLRVVIRYSSAIVEGQVSSAEYVFDDRIGPRAVYSMEKVHVVSGSEDFQNDSISISMLGGPMGEDQVLLVDFVPRLTRGQRYILFLRNDDIPWFASPVTGSYAFLVTQVLGKHLVVDQECRIVLGVDGNFVARGKEILHGCSAYTDDFSSPALIDGIGEEDVRGAISPEEFIISLRSYMDRVGVWPSGRFLPSPDPEKIWNLIEGERRDGSIDQCSTGGADCGSSGAEDSEGKGVNEND